MGYRCFVRLLMTGLPTFQTTRYQQCGEEGVRMLHRMPRRYERSCRALYRCMGG